MILRFAVCYLLEIQNLREATEWRREFRFVKIAGNWKRLAFDGALYFDSCIGGIKRVLPSMIRWIWFRMLFSLQHMRTHRYCKITSKWRTLRKIQKNDRLSHLSDSIESWFARLFIIKVLAIFSKRHFYTFCSVDSWIVGFENGKWSQSHSNTKW